MLQKCLFGLIASFACYGHARTLIDISDYNINLNDNADDSALFQKIINDSQDNGVILLSGSGSLFLKKSVQVKDKNLTIVGVEKNSPRIIKQFPSTNTNPAIRFVASNRACHWKMINVRLSAFGANRGTGMIVRDTNGHARGSTFEFRGGEFNSGDRGNFYERHLDVDGMGYVRLETKMSGNLESVNGYKTKSLVRLIGKKTGTLEAVGAGRMRAVDIVYHIAADYDTIKISGGRVQNNKGIFIEPGKKGRRFILRDGNAQTDAAVNNVQVSELVSVGGMRYAKPSVARGAKISYEFKNSKNAAIHFFGSKLADGIKFQDSKHLLFVGNTLGSARVSGSADNIVAGGNMRIGQGYDYHDALTYSGGSNLSKLRILVMEAIK